MSVYTFFDGQYVSLLILVACEQEAFKKAVFKFGPQHKINGPQTPMVIKKKLEVRECRFFCQLHPLDLNSSQSTLPRSLRWFKIRVKD